jgi:hypothetical protein
VEEELSAKFSSILALRRLLIRQSFCFCRIVRAFLVEEQKIVKKVLKIQKSKEKAAAKASA